MSDDALAILPSSMGKEPPGAQQPKRKDPTKFIPAQRGGLLLADPTEQECPYTFSDSPGYLRNKKAAEDAKRAAELEGKDETRGFLRGVEELAKRQQWSEAFQMVERRTAVPSGLFLVARAALRWKFGKYRGALGDAAQALEKYGSSAKAGPLAAAFSCFARICLGAQVREREACSREMREAVEAWERAEERALSSHVLGHGLFQPARAERLAKPEQLDGGVEAIDGDYLAAPRVKIGYTLLLRSAQGGQAPLIVHFHGSAETAAQYRQPELAGRYAELGAHLLAVDYRGYGWSDGQPSLTTLLHDAEAFTEQLPKILVERGLPWPYQGGLIISGRSVGAQVAVHIATMFPKLFRAVVLDSAAAAAATGDRLGRAPERSAALEIWRRDLEKASLEVLQPLDADLCRLSAIEKIRAFEGRLLVLHGLSDELVPYEASEGLHAAAGTRDKELVLIEGAGHNNIGRFDAYWAALRRLCSMAQLDASEPSVGDVVEHLCAVCAAKAASKCGRCQKVWYCCRAHQAEHWKAHKLTCAGGPPEPTAKSAPPESDAHVVALLIACVRHTGAVAALGRAVAALAAQEMLPDEVIVRWQCSAPLAEQAALRARVEAVFRDLEAGLATRGAPAPTVAEATSTGAAGDSALGAAPLFGFGLLDALAALPKERPATTWVKFVDAAEALSPQHFATLAPTLRRASADPRIVAVSCPQHARPRSMDGAGSAGDVEALLSSGQAELASEEAEASLGDLVVRLQTLRTFLDGTPAPVLAHSLCAHRLRCKLASSFGKKVQTLAAPEGTWMRWVDVASSPAAPTEADASRGRALHGSVQSAAASAQPGESAGPLSPGSLARRRLDSPEGAISEMAALRRRMEKCFILRAGETIPRRELRSTALDFMHSLLQEVGLQEVIGIERWARETAEDIAREAADEFAVQVVED